MADRLVIQCGAFALGGPEGLAGKRRVHNAHPHFALLGVGDGHRNLRMAVSVVHRAVDGVDYPQWRFQLFCLGQIRHGFLGEDAVVGEAFADGAGDEFVGHHVGVGDQFGLVFVVGAQGVFFPLVADQFAGFAGQGFGEIGDFLERN